MNTLIVIGVAAVAVVIGIVGIFVAIKKFYQVPEADEALVKTGGKAPKVSTGGGLWVIPMFHKVARVSLQAIRVPINRTGIDAVPSQDMIPAEIKGEMFVQVNPEDQKAILLAVQALGTSHPDRMTQLVQEKVDSQVTDALRTAAFRRSFIGLNAEKKEFADDVQQMLGEDIAKLGLTLTAVSITHVTQGEFSADAGDVIAAQGRRNVAETVEKNRRETNLIQRAAEVDIQKQDVDAREQALSLDLRQKQKEADQAREVAEYEAQQTAATRREVLNQEQAVKEAEAAQDRAVQQAQIEEARKVEEAQIDKAKAVAIAKAKADALKVAEEAAKREAEEEAQRREQEAEIAKAKAVEAAKIAKEQAIKVADEKRQQAIEEAEVERQKAVALVRAEEAEARAAQALKEAEQKGAEEKIITVKETAMADRQKQVVVIKAEEEAQKDKIQADKAAYVAAKTAEGERDAARNRADAQVATAKGEADSKKARATGEADAIKIAAEGYATDIKTRAEADFEAADQQAQAKIKLATATLKQGEAEAEARRLMVEAENSLSNRLIMQSILLAGIQQAPAAIRELMAPVANVAHDVKILQVHGLGGGADGESTVQGLPRTILETGLAAAGVAPFLKGGLQAVMENPEVQDMTALLGGVAKGALKEAVKGVKEGLAESSNGKGSALSAPAEDA